MLNDLYASVIRLYKLPFNPYRRGLKAVSIEKSQKNQARLADSVVPELVDEYCLRYKQNPNGAPPLVAYYDAEGDLVLIDGNNRLLAALKANVSDHDFYIVESKDMAKIASLTFNFNRLVNGLRNPKDSATAQALILMESFKYKSAAAAKEMGVSVTALMRAKRIQDGKLALMRCNFKSLAMLSDDRVYRLSSLLRIGDEIMAGCAEVSIKYSLSNELLTELIEDVQAAKSFAAKNAVIAKFGKRDDVHEEEQRRQLGLAANQHLPKDRLQRMIVGAARLFGRTDDLSELRPIPGDVPKARTAAVVMIKNLIKLFELTPKDWK